MKEQEETYLVDFGQERFIYNHEDIHYLDSSSEVGELKVGEVKYYVGYYRSADNTFLFEDINNPSEYTEEMKNEILQQACIVALDGGYEDWREGKESTDVTISVNKAYLVEDTDGDYDLKIEKLKTELYEVFDNGKVREVEYFFDYGGEGIIARSREEFGEKNCLAENDSIKLGEEKYFVGVYRCSDDLLLYYENLKDPSEYTDVVKKKILQDGIEMYRELELPNTKGYVDENDNKVRIECTRLTLEICDNEYYIYRHELSGDTYRLYSSGEVELD